MLTGTSSPYTSLVECLYGYYFKLPNTLYKHDCLFLVVSFFQDGLIDAL